MPPKPAGPSAKVRRVFLPDGQPVWIVDEKLVTVHVFVKVGKGRDTHYVDRPYQYMSAITK